MKEITLQGDRQLGKFLSIMLDSFALTLEAKGILTKEERLHLFEYALAEAKKESTI